MAYSFGLFNDREVVLRILRTPAIVFRAEHTAFRAVLVTPSLVDKELRQVQVLLIAGFLVESRQTDLDFLVAGNVVVLSGAELRNDQIRVLDRHIEQRSLACRAEVCDCGLVHVTDVVELVAVNQVVPPLIARVGASLGGVERSDRVEITVIFLCGGDLGDEVIEIGGQFRVVCLAKRVRCTLNDLEDVRVVVALAPMGAYLQSSRSGEIADSAGFLALAEVRGDCDGASRFDSRLPERVAHLHGSERNCREAGTLGSGHVRANRVRLRCAV